jgi:hypothetical protein
MFKQMRAEWIKVFSTRTWMGIVLAAFVFTGMTVFGYAQIAGTLGIPTLEHIELMNLLYGGSATGVALALILGVVGATAEYRYGTVDHTYLISPNRSRVLVAKLAVHGLIGALVGLSSFGIAFGATAAAISGKSHATVETTSLLKIGGATIAAFAIYAMLGVAFGSLVRNQLVGVAATFGWIFIFERLLVVFTPDLGKWLPGGAVNGLFGVTAIMNGQDYLPRSEAALMLLLYAAVLIGACLIVTPKRDVTG